MNIKGFSALILLLVVPLLAGVLFVASNNYSPFGQVEEGAKEDLAGIQQRVGSNVSWQFGQTNKTWQAIGVPPSCPESLTFPAPADVKLASSVLYPGQIRGGDYKPHGGFRFDGQGNSIDVYAPMDGNLFQAARHPTNGEIQYVLYFINDCGIAYKLDHLLEVTEKFSKIIEKIPMGGEGDSRTTGVEPPVFVAKGEHVATKVGLELTKNVFFDFGVYDLRKRNGVDYSDKNYYNVEQYAMHATCWLDNLEEPHKSVALSLPGADSQSGKTSDYCKRR